MNKLDEIQADAALWVFDHCAEMVKALTTWAVKAPYMRKRIIERVIILALWLDVKINRIETH